MKLYALAFLFTVCLFEIEAARDWRSDTKINYWQQINSIVNPALAQIRSEVNAKGTGAAEACYERARLSFASASSTGYNEVSSCVRAPAAQGPANVCSQQAVSRVFEKRLVIHKEATACINKT
ncbi:uncharacterized protein LOC131673868 [Phymastichus coffea]|uniref:uncharacterized protein LOC131673868 n=1 Tax=Phymastichus coffea TaxID=108790 RepID=UPI00273B2C8D|nr:uncharacterized protein LOC131673868 [Phymastichus coffea]